MLTHQELLRRITPLIFCVLLLAGCKETQAEPTLAPTAAPAATDERFDLDEDLYLRQIQEGVYIITHAFPWAANSMVVEMADSTLLLVDTPYTPEATRAALEWVQARLGQREIVAINTGFHHDNLGGNSYLLEAGIPVYGPDLTVELLEERGDQMRAQTLGWLEKPEDARYRQVHETLLYVPPDHVFPIDAGLELQFGAETVQVYYPGPSHSPDNVVVYFPSRKILFGGCMIIGWDKVGNTSDADLNAWPDSVRKLSQFDFDVLVPGHGERLDPALLEHTLDLLTR
jgi:glyoxylase-like metal-dependent hydrolase (beta-lactamase superfamily II)